MSEKKASIHWEGAGKTGQGQISTETGALNKHPYGFGSRFGDDRSGTNPEEIVGAAHAACFTMAFAFAAEKAGHSTEMLDTTASVWSSPGSVDIFQLPFRSCSNASGLSWSR